MSPRVTASKPARWLARCASAQPLTPGPRDGPVNEPPRDAEPGRSSDGFVWRRAGRVEGDPLIGGGGRERRAAAGLGPGAERARPCRTGDNRPSRRRIAHADGEPQGYAADGRLRVRAPGGLP